MIIKEVKLDQRLFFGDKVVILTDGNKISFSAEWDNKLVKELDDKLKNFKIENADDLVLLRNKLKDLNLDIYYVFENAILKHFKSGWKFINPSAIQVPRPMNVVLKKENGIKEFLVFSLNAKNFPIALDSNRHVIDRINKNLDNLRNLSEENILMSIKEAMDKEHDLIDFELRLGAVFDNYKDGKYNYNNKDLTREEQFEFVSKLINKYDLVYAENPFKEDDLEMYKKLTEKFRKKSLVCMNSNNYKLDTEKKLFNCVVARFENVADFKSCIDIFKEKKLNIVVDGKESAMEAAVGLNIPLVKLTDDRTGDAAAHKLNSISEQILTSRLSEQKA